MFLTLTVSAASFFTVPWNCFPVQPALNSVLTLSWVGGWTLRQGGNPLRSPPTQIIPQMCDQQLCGWYQPGLQRATGHPQLVTSEALCPSCWKRCDGHGNVLYWTGLLWNPGCHSNGHRDVQDTFDKASVKYNNFQAVFLQAMAFQILLLQNCY